MKRLFSARLVNSPGTGRRIVQRFSPRFSIIFALLLASGSTLPARAASTDWVAAQGGNVRLVTSGPVAMDGTLRGLLEIDLKPGWKTYWRDPGEAGVPPSLDVSKSENVASALIGFPAPERHDDGYGPWAGYGASVSLPVTFRLMDAAKPWRLRADAFLGICQNICIPVQADFVVSSDQKDDAEDKAAVDAAIKTLPLPASDAFGIASVEREGNRVSFTARLPEGAEKPELFVDGIGTFTFENMTSAQTPDGWRFAARVSPEPGAEKPKALPYTLKAGDRAVSGSLPLR